MFVGCVYSDVRSIEYGSEVWEGSKGEADALESIISYVHFYFLVSFCYISYPNFFDFVSKICHFCVATCLVSADV